ncbi:MAG: hypothetical protein DDT34_01838 [Firmicutes bacterium]|nr:hypothetical protein [Bacillota bacterium]
MEEVHGVGIGDGIVVRRVGQNYLKKPSNLFSSRLLERLRAWTSVYTG